MTDPAPVEGRITTEVREHVLVIGFDRVAKRNAFGPEMITALSAACGRVQASLHSAQQELLEGFAVARDQLGPTLQRLSQTEDAQEGMMSFVERRPANFKGR